MMTKSPCNLNRDAQKMDLARRLAKALGRPDIAAESARAIQEARIPSSEINGDDQESVDARATRNLKRPA